MIPFGFGIIMPLGRGLVPLATVVLEYLRHFVADLLSGYVKYGRWLWYTILSFAYLQDRAKNQDSSSRTIYEIQIIYYPTPSSSAQAKAAP